MVASEFTIVQAESTFPELQHYMNLYRRSTLNTLIGLWTEHQFETANEAHIYTYACTGKSTNNHQTSINLKQDEIQYR